MESITKNDLKGLLGVTKDVDLAKFFQIGKAAVGHWADDEPIPEGRYWQARALRPELFPSAGDDATEAA